MFQHQKCCDVAKNYLVKTSQTNFISIAIRITKTNLLDEIGDTRLETFIPTY